MSLKTKIAVIFSVIVSLILIINNVLNYMHTKDFLINEKEKQMEVIAQEIQIVIDYSQSVDNNIENLVGEKLYIAAVAAKTKLDPKVKNVTNEQLKDLSKELNVSHITLFSRFNDDIKVVKSSDSAEINLSAKKLGGIWFTALQQLMSQGKVTVSEGQKLPHYWSGPMEISSSNSNHVDKWGYYYDGTTDYIINPYNRDTNFKGIKKFEGAETVIKQTLEYNDDLLEITGFNPKTFGKYPIFSYNKEGKKFIYLSDKPVYFGNYTYKIENIDVHAVQQAAQTKKAVNIKEHSKGKYVIKSFIPVFKAEDPYVIGIVTDYMAVERLLNKYIMSNIYISVLFIIIVFSLSYFFSRYIMKPINYVLKRVNEIARGDFGTFISLKRKDELGILASSINSMSINLKEYTDHIKYQAYHDPLTDLPNQRYFNKQIDKVLIEAEKNMETVGVMFLDLDRFKLINDLYGHSFADMLLQSLAERLKMHITEKQLIARMGGDEFAIILANTSHHKIRETAQNLLEQCTTSFVIEGQEIYITPSIGISLYPFDGKDKEILLKKADKAMYRAKENGKNTFQFFDLDINNVTSRKILLEKDLHKAYKNKDFFLHYQPQFNIKNNNIIGVEALIRWNHPEFGLVSPAEFIPLAEESGLIHKIGEWVLESVCKQNRNWIDRGLTSIQIAVNISVLQFQKDDLIDKISQIINESQMDPQYLELEITEGVVMRNVEYVIGRLNQLKSLGIKISMDDFGTGYSSLNNLKRLPVDTLKIDKSFMENIDNDSSDKAIVRAIIAMAKNLKMNIIAEGIENEKQRAFLEKEGGLYAQGYLFSIPLPLEEFERILIANNKRMGLV